MSFIKDNSLVEENHKISDQFDYAFLTNKVDALIKNAPNYSIICLVGAYGSGKSTVLHQLEIKHKNKIWFEFDAWKYPDRKDLWENFVLELARKFDEKAFKKVEAEIDGKQNDDKKALIDTIGGIPGAGGLKGLKHFVRTSPATRTYQVQKILTELIERNLKEKEVIIIIEDIDRSGDAGVFFLETLKSYLRTLDSPNLKIKCVVPIATTNYEKHTDSYLKSTDIIESFRTPHPQLQKYMEQVLSSEYFDPLAITQVTSFCIRLFMTFQDQMSPRRLKHILRVADTKFESMQQENLLVDPRIVIAIEASKVLSAGGSDTKLFRDFLANKRIDHDPFHNLLAAIEYNKSLDDSSVDDHVQKYQLSDIREPQGNDKVCLPWKVERIGVDVVDHFIHNFYFDY